MLRPFALLALCSAALLGACVGEISTPGSGDDAPGGGSTATQSALNEVGVSGARRLTAAEYDATVMDLLGIADPNSETALPEDLHSPFDNDYQKQLASEALINSADSLAAKLADQVTASTTLREKLVPCTPNAASDGVCFEKFLRSFGRRALRRPLTDEDVTRFMTLLDHGTSAGDFWVAVNSALRAFLQHPELLYRIELGSAVSGKPGLFRLNDFEIATRLSYLLWGSTPPDSLLDAAASGKLSTASGVRAAAKDLLDDDRAKARVSRFHSMWLGYEKLPHSPELSADMQTETNALLDRVIFEHDSPWLDLLRSKETFLTPSLAEHYGLPAPAGNKPGWVSYGSSGRQGLLSQGSFLSAVAKFDDTSPTQRGLLIRTRLFCMEIHKPPPELKVNSDEPPAGPDPDACKADRYVMWKTDGCSSCHSLMDPVGFGLENYDSSGRYRDHEPDRPDCPIDGEGFVEGVGTFKGPAELSDRLIETGELESCVAKQYLRFSLGRYALDEHDANLLSRLVAVAEQSGELSFETLMLELTGSESFRYRREEPTP